MLEYGRPQGGGGGEAGPGPAQPVWDRLAAWAPDPATLAQVSAMLFDPPRQPDNGRQPGPRHKCGSVKAYRQHLYYKEKPCDQCKAAWNRYKASLPTKARTPSKAPYEIWPDCGTNKAYHRHLYWQQETCPACKQAHSELGSANDRRRRKELKALKEDPVD